MVDDNLYVSNDEVVHVSCIEASFKLCPRMLLSWAVWSNEPNTAELISSRKSDTRYLIDSTSQSGEFITQTLCRFSGFMKFLAIDLRVGSLRYRPRSALARYDATRMHIILKLRVRFIVTEYVPNQMEVNY